MRTKRWYWIAILACFFVLTIGCDGNRGKVIPKTINISVNQDFTNVCKIDEYTTLCWTVGLEPPPSGHIHDLDMTMTNPLLAIPSSTRDGHIEFEASGTFRTRVISKISPALLLGTPAPFCAAVDPVDGPSVGVLVVDWTVRGNYSVTQGDRIDCKSGDRETENVLIKERTISIQEFDIRDTWDRADQQIKRLVKSTIRSEIDRQVHSKLVLGCIFDGGPADDAQIFVDGTNVEEAGFCQ